MKTNIALFICSLIFFTGLKVAAQDNIKSEQLKVYGNCEMCKTTIESALKKKDGILSKNWNVDTKILTVTFDTDKITLQQIAQKVANAGYDNELATASEDAYKGLHTCCQYDRPKK